ncbi:MAG TPA: hypothetical protein VES95_04570 [Dermatophilaceae bacterium]|nr:hypothetical protein [Dermatophilaceae bacterium]
MAGPEPTPLRRRFVTRVDVEAAHRAGEAVTLAPLDVITHEAAQRAADLGVTVSRPERAAPPAATAPRPRAPGGGRLPDDGGLLREAVRAAVVAELGAEPPGLDAAIDTVLGRRSG